EIEEMEAGFEGEHRAVALVAERQRADGLRQRPGPAAVALGIAGMYGGPQAVDPIETFFRHVPERPLAELGLGIDDHFHAQHRGYPLLLIPSPTHPLHSSSPQKRGSRASDEAGALDSCFHRNDEREE